MNQNIRIPEIIKALTPTKIGVRAFLFIGKAGTGKTSTAEMIARQLRAKLIFIQCTAGISENQLIYDFIPNEKTKSGIKLIEGKLVEAVKESKKTKIVLVLDEWDKTRPSADAFLLDFLQNARISWKINGEESICGNKNNLTVILTSNGERELSEPLLRRLIVVKFNLLDTSTLYSILTEQYNVCKKHALLLAQIYEDTKNASLDKPATIQELIILEQLLHNSSSSFEELLFSCVIKTEEAWEQFCSYLKANGKSRLLWKNTKNTENLKEHYTGEIEEIQQEEKQEEIQQEEKQECELKLKKINIDFPKTNKIEKNEEVSSFIMFDEGYDILARIYPPSADATKIASWSVRDRYIVTNDSLMFPPPDEFMKLKKGRLFCEGTLLINDEGARYYALSRKSESKSEIRLYSSKTIVIKSEDDIIRLDKTLCGYHITVSISPQKIRWTTENLYKILKEYAFTVSELKNKFPNYEWTLDIPTTVYPPDIVEIVKIMSKYTEHIKIEYVYENSNPYIMPCYDKIIVNQYPEGEWWKNKEIQSLFKYIIKTDNLSIVDKTIIQKLIVNKAEFINKSGYDNLRVFIDKNGIKFQFGFKLYSYLSSKYKDISANIQQIADDIAKHGWSDAI